MSTQRLQGTVKWFDDAKGFGFIIPDKPLATDKNVFVHYSGIQGTGYKSLEKDDQVEFEICEDERGVKAINVAKVV